MSLNEIESATDSPVINQEFLEMVQEKTLDNGAVKRLLGLKLSVEKTNTLISKPEDRTRLTTKKSNLLNEDRQGATIPEAPAETGIKTETEILLGAASNSKSQEERPTEPVKEWRRAEDYVRQVFMNSGWKAIDVSRQNIGYDIVCSRGEEKIYIEVKLIDSPSSAITITSNEEAVARQHGDRYKLAIVRLFPRRIELSLVSNPSQSLQLTRQCRQWVYECKDYPFMPTSFDLF